MSCLVLAHLVNGVMDGIEILLFSASSEILLACASASLSLNTHFEVLLRGVCEYLTKELCELGSMLCLFMRSLLIIQSDLRISLTESDSGHSQVHADFGALAVEVSLQILDDLRIYALCDADNVLVSPSCTFLNLVEFGCRSSALRTFLRWFWSFVNVTTN